MGVDFRLNYDGLYGFTVSVPSPTNPVVKLYKIDPRTGVATFTSLQSALPGVSEMPAGFSFDPIDTFRIRYVNVNDENARFSAGVFVCISLGDLLPELEFHSHDRVKLSAMLLIGVALAYGIGLLEPKHAHQTAGAIRTVPAEASATTAIRPSAK